MLLWSSRNQPRVPSASRLLSLANTTGGKRKSGHLAAGKPNPKPVKVRPTGSGSSCKERNKRRRRRKGKRIVPGGTKTRGKVHGDDPTPMQQTKSLLNQKRNAASYRWLLEIQHFTPPPKDTRLPSERKRSRQLEATCRPVF